MNESERIVKVIIIGTGKFDDIKAAVEAVELSDKKIIVVEDIVDGINELDPDVLELRPSPMKDGFSVGLPTKKELHDQKMERLNKRRR